VVHFRPVLRTPLHLGDLVLGSRLVQTGLRPGQPLAAAAAVSIVSPAWVAPEGAGEELSAGIWRDADVAAWRRFTRGSAVEGRSVVLPLWHAGRLAHPLAQPGGGHPVAPSPVPAPGVVHTWAGLRSFPVPRALRAEELPALVRLYADAARRARLAGFDAVEVHAGGGGLLQQFLDPRSNLREDAHGGTAATRARLPFEVVSAVADAVGPGALGLVLPWHDAAEGPAPREAELALLERLRPLGLAWLRLEAPQPRGAARAETVRALRHAFGGPTILGPVQSEADAIRLVSDGLADAVAAEQDARDLAPFGRSVPQIATPPR
jgi:N-ethylmaleimide reductase